MTEKQLRYDIISDACTREEFFVLITGIDYKCHEELRLFLKVLADLVNEGLLLYERGGVKKNSLTYSELQTYVDQRLGADESLDEYPDVCEEYVFTTTDKGLEWLDAQYRVTTSRAQTIIDALERYKQDHSIYPKKLEDLLPQYLDQIEPPVEYHGYWKYETYNNLTEYKLKFGADLEYSVVHEYDPRKRKWDFDEKKE
jgi:predicted transcriptional regulator